MARPCQAIDVTSESESDAQAADALAPGKGANLKRHGQGPGRPPSKKQRVLAWLADRGLDSVSEARSHALAQVFSDCSEDTLRNALLESGLPLAPVVEGVVQDSYRRLEESLAALLTEYLAAQQSGDKRRVHLIRSAVIRAKEHTDLAAHNPRVHELKRNVKLEMALWLRTWRENPPLVPAWVELRMRRPPEMAAEPSPEPESEG